MFNMDLINLQNLLPGVLTGNTECSSSESINSLSIATNPQYNCSSWASFSCVTLYVIIQSNLKSSGLWMVFKSKQNTTTPVWSGNRQ